MIRFDLINHITGTTVSQFQKTRLYASLESKIFKILKMPKVSINVLIKKIQKNKLVVFLSNNHHVFVLGEFIAARSHISAMCAVKGLQPRAISTTTG